jgi:hypothetical protein
MRISIPDRRASQLPFAVASCKSMRSGSKRQNSLNSLMRKSAAVQALHCPQQT